MTKLNALALALFAALPAAAEDWSSARSGALARCAARFEDFALQAVCLRNEEEAHQKMQGDFALPAPVARKAKKRCERSFKEFSLQAACMENESEAYRRDHPEVREPVGAQPAALKQTEPPPAAQPAKASEPAADPLDVIRRHCQSEWDKDAQMRTYCEERQREGLSALAAGKPSDIPEPDFEVVRARCAAEWPENFKMRASCEEGQFQGLRQLRR